MTRLMHYQLCIYEQVRGEDDPLRAQYVAHYETGERQIEGATWDERLATFLLESPHLPHEGWRMTVGNPTLCEYYRAVPPPFGMRLILRIPASLEGASALT